MLIQEKTSKRHTLEKSDEKELAVKVELGIGKLKLSGGTEKIMDGTFIYRGEVSPTIEYEQEDDQGQLLVSQKSVNRKVQLFSSKQEWQIALNEQLPMELNIELGTGKSDLELSRLNLQALSIDTGVGESVIDLSGGWEKSFKTKLNTGVGKTKIIISKSVGVRMKVSKGVGKVHADYFMTVGDSYQNQAYDTADVKIDIDLNVGVGDIVLEQI